MESYLPDTLDWLWYSPNTILGDIDGMGSIAEPSPDVPTIRTDFEGEDLDSSGKQIRPQTPSVRPGTAFAKDEPVALDKSRSSSRNSLVFGRPWRAFRMTERLPKRSTAFGDSNLSASVMVLPTTAESGSVFDQVSSHLSTERLTTQEFHSDSPYQTHTPLNYAASHAELSTTIGHPDTSTFPLLLRRSISPVPSRLRRPPVCHKDVYSSSNFSQPVLSQSRHTSGFGLSSSSTTQPLDSVIGPLGSSLSVSSTVPIPNRPLVRYSQFLSRSTTPRFEPSFESWGSGLSTSRTPHSSSAIWSDFRGLRKITSVALSDIDTGLHTSRSQLVGPSSSDSSLLRTTKPITSQQPATSQLSRPPWTASMQPADVSIETTRNETPGRSELLGTDIPASRIQAPVVECYTSVPDNVSRTTSTSTSTNNSTATTYHVPRLTRTPAQMALERYRNRKQTPTGNP